MHGRTLQPSISGVKSTEPLCQGSRQREMGGEGRKEGMAGGDSAEERALSYRRTGWAQGWRERGQECWMFRVKERMGGSSPGRQQEYAGKRGRGRRSVIMEEWSCSQCGRWDGEITRPGVGQRWEEGRSRQLSSPPRAQLGRKEGRKEVFSPQWSMQLWGREHDEGKLLLCATL